MPIFIPLSTYREYPPEEMLTRARDYYNEMRQRRTVRQATPPVFHAPLAIPVATVFTRKTSDTATTALTVPQP